MGPSSFLVFVLLELKLGLVAGGIADFGGLIVVIGLVGMLVGVLRYSGSLDVAETQPMTSPRRILILGGILIAAFGMLFGLHYAVFVEHQTLDRMGGSLATAFVQAANRDMTQARTAIDSYAVVKYDYVRAGRCPFALGWSFNDPDRVGHGF